MKGCVASLGALDARPLSSLAQLTRQLPSLLCDGGQVGTVLVLCIHIMHLGNPIRTQGVHPSVVCRPFECPSFSGTDDASDHSFL